MTIIKFKDKNDKCQFCGTEPDHSAYWGCPRIKAVAMDCDGNWSVEFIEDYFDIEFVSEIEIETEADKAD